MIHLVLIDDHAAFRQPLAFMLQREPDVIVIAEVGTIAEARPWLAAADAMLVDLDLPDGNGAELIREYCAAQPNGRAIVLTASADNRSLAPAAEVGADALIHKSKPFADIVSVLRRVCAGEQVMSREEVRLLVEAARQERRHDSAMRQALGSLTRREREVLDALGDGLNDKEIADRLFISSETVRTHVVNLLRKLGVSSRLQAVVIAARHGGISFESRH